MKDNFIGFRIERVIEGWKKKIFIGDFEVDGKGSVIFDMLLG